MASTTGSRAGAANARERAEKKVSPFKSRNPLKSLNSDETIQRNPRQSKAHRRGLRSETARSQENPKELTGPMSRPYDTKSKCIISSLVCSKNLRVAEQRA